MQSVFEVKEEECTHIEVYPLMHGDKQMIDNVGRPKVYCGKCGKFGIVGLQNIYWTNGQIK